ncbi:hypothetical protein HK096_002047 [Nowakowskiella sp. JEL0078]|nr:hypothetical protein HK096_002047 [Nowakowskiella sp. JEL0078]
MGTHVLLEAARVHNIKRTDEVYGEIDKNKPDCTEETILAPSNPYSATKAAAEYLVTAYHKSFKLPVIITRSNNVYGPLQYPEKVIPNFIHGDGTPTRRYLYASDAAEAMDTILHHGEIGETYNIGTEFEISNIDLARYLLVQFGILKKDYLENVEKDPRSIQYSSDELKKADEHFDYVVDRRCNDHRYAIDSTKLTKMGWKPRISFQEGIKRTIAWYCENDAESWWENVSGALVAHPKHKQLPELASLQ